MVKQYGTVRFRLLLLMALSALSACGGKTVESAPDGKIAESRGVRSEEESIAFLSMATNGDWSKSFKGQLMEKELNALEQGSGGHVKIRLYDRSRLGDDTHLIAGVQTGTIDIVQSSPSMQISAVPEAALFDIPGFFDTTDEWNQLFTGDYRRVMESYYEQAGLVLLDIFAYSYRNLSSREPIIVPGDLQGVRIRTMENKYHEAFWSSLGAKTVPYRYAELYFCLNEGLADAQENLLDVMLSDNLYEVQSCVTFTRHMPVVSAIAMNRDAYERLTGEQKTKLKEFTGSLKSSLIGKMPEEEERLAETLDNDYGIEMHDPSVELEERIAAGFDVVMNLLREELGDDKVDIFLKEAEKVRR